MANAPPALCSAPPPAPCSAVRCSAATDVIAAAEPDSAGWEGRSVERRSAFPFANTGLVFASRRPLSSDALTNDEPANCGTCGGGKLLTERDVDRIVFGCGNFGGI